MLVWSEFLGVIRGSEESLLTEDGYLDRQVYMGLSERQRPAFATRREKIYNLFLSYLKFKGLNGGHDAADRYV
jgi:hypothetical protein